VTVRPEVPYRETEAGALTCDVYYPPDATSAERRPAVLMVLGYSDAARPHVFGRTFKAMGSTVSWAQLIAASGMVAIAYSNREPVEDVGMVLQYVRDNASRLGIDETRLGLWAASGNVPLALWLLMRKEWPALTCATLCYGFMLDLHGATAVADMQKTFCFANPCAGKSVDDVRDDVPLLIVRAGRDQFAGINESIDGFVRDAVQRDLPVTMINHAGAPHAFDLFDDSDTSREIIRQILRFMQCHLFRPAEAGHYRGNRE
jgi:acetyl esterase/lipase